MGRKLRFLHLGVGAVVTTLFIIDDRESIRHALAQRLERAPGLTVVGSAGGGEESLRLIGSLRPDVVLLELKLIGGDGLDTLHAIRADFPAVRLIILTSYLDEFEREVALKAGAEDYLLKDIDSQKLADVILAPGGTPRDVASDSDATAQTV